LQCPRLRHLIPQSCDPHFGVGPSNSDFYQQATPPSDQKLQSSELETESLVSQPSPTIRSDILWYRVLSFGISQALNELDMSRGATCLNYCHKLSPSTSHHQYLKSPGAFEVFDYKDQNVVSHCCIGQIRWNS
jgi:hypothetical protein